MSAPTLTGQRGRPRSDLIQIRKWLSLWLDRRDIVRRWARQVYHQLTDEKSAAAMLESSRVRLSTDDTYFSAILFKVFSEAFMSASVRPTSSPLSSTPIW